MDDNLAFVLIILVFSIPTIILALRGRSED
jgi:hypothetical protein